MEENNESRRDTIEQIRLLKRIGSRFPSFRGESVLALLRRMQQARTPELERHRLECGPYNPQWPDLFHRQAGRLKQSLPSQAKHRLFHIGSTAIPGMASNPVIDMALVLECDGLWEDCRRVLETAGYHHFGNSPMGPEAEWYWDTGRPEAVFVLHMDGTGNQWLEENLRFCRYLADHPAERERYLAFKEEHRDMKQRNIILYSLKKLEFIMEIAKRAKP
jgi:GrpB-like predicted nucleotidyltransferase (UPF0157 family)